MDIKYFEGIVNKLNKPTQQDSKSFMDEEFIPNPNNDYRIWMDTKNILLEKDIDKLRNIILKKNFNVFITNIYDGNTLIHEGLENIEIEYKYEEKVLENIITFLIENGSPSNQMNKYDQSPIQLACKHGYLNIVKKLYENGALLFFSDINGLTSLHYACMSSEIKYIKKLYPKNLINKNDGDKKIIKSYTKFITKEILEIMSAQEGDSKQIINDIFMILSNCRFDFYYYKDSIQEFIDEISSQFNKSDLKEFEKEAKMIDIKKRHISEISDNFKKQIKRDEIQSELKESILNNFNNYSDPKKTNKYIILKVDIYKEIIELMKERNIKKY